MAKIVHFEMPKEDAEGLALELRTVIEGTLKSMPFSTLLLILLQEQLEKPNAQG